MSRIYRNGVSQGQRKANLSSVILSSVFSKFDNNSVNLSLLSFKVHFKKHTNDKDHFMETYSA